MKKLLLGLMLCCMSFGVQAGEKKMKVEPTYDTVYGFVEFMYIQDAAFHKIMTPSMMVYKGGTHTPAALYMVDTKDNDNWKMFSMDLEKWYNFIPEDKIYVKE